MDKTQEILATEFHEPFVQGMRDRMVVSFYKYGHVANAKNSDNLKSLVLRLKAYTDGIPEKGIAAGNLEYLMDVANFAMIEFMHPQKASTYFLSTDSDASPGRVARRTGEVTDAPNDIIGRAHKSVLADFR